MNDGHEDSTYRSEFVSVLNEALHSEEIRRALRRAEGASGEPGGPALELLRARTLAAADELAAPAAAEYARYAALRAGARAARGRDGTNGNGHGPGVSATLAVLVPMLSGIGAAAFLALGFGLRAAGSGHRATTSLIGVGFAMASVFGAALLVGLGGLVLTARRDAETARVAQEAAAAREAWRRALLTQGVLPHLRELLADEARALGRPAPGQGVSLVRTRPRLGYTSPGFGSSSASSSEGGVSLVRNRPRLGYTSPGFTSPSDSD